MNQSVIENQCQSMTLKGQLCKKKCMNGNIYCGIHYKKYKFEKPNECPICFEEMKENFPLSCSHWVHRTCILKWGKHMCPICREPLKLTSGEKKKFEKQHKDNIAKFLSILSRIPSYTEYREIDGENYRFIQVDIDSFSPEELIFIQQNLM